MRLQYRLTFQDSLAAQALHAKRSEFPYIGYLVPRYLFPVIGICSLAWAVSKRGSASYETWLIIAGLYLLACPLLVRLSYKRHFGRTRTTDQQTTIEFDSGLIHCQGPHSKSEIEWSAIRSFSEDSKMLLLYLAPGKFLCIPKRACADGQVDELRSLFQERIKPRQSPN